MTEHIYVLSNPSVPGVVKIGKTASSLDQKMAELHAADDPIPLLLEFYAHVKNGEASERAAHAALAEHRIDMEHKFFRTSAEHALKTIVPVIGEHVAVDVSEVNKPLTPEEAYERRRLIAERKEAERVAKIIIKDKAERAARRERRKEIEKSINDERRNLHRLGHRLGKPVLPLFWFACLFCYSPLPVGWLFWLGALGVFYPSTLYLGYCCIFLLVMGYLAHRIDGYIDYTYSRAIEPYLPIDDRIRGLITDLKELAAASR
jgi:hypothetical protein